MLWFNNCWSSRRRISLIFSTSFFSSISSCFSVFPSFSACCLASCSISLVISSMNRKMELSSPSTVAKRSPNMLATGSRFALKKRKTQASIAIELINTLFYPQASKKQNQKKYNAPMNGNLFSSNKKVQYMWSLK